jgi:hypothetical protein
MNLDKKQISWLVSNGTFLLIVALGCGIWPATANLLTEWLLYFFCWLLAVAVGVCKLVTYLMLTNAKIIEKDNGFDNVVHYNRAKIPKSIDVSYDIIILALLLSGGFVITAGAYLFHILVGDWAYQDLSKLHELGYIKSETEGEQETGK